jgi:hypothetical protein
MGNRKSTATQSVSGGTPTPRTASIQHMSIDSSSSLRLWDPALLQQCRCRNSEEE